MKGMENQPERQFERARRARRNRIRLFVLVCVGLLVGGCQPSESDSRARGSFWTILRIEGEEVEHYSSLRDMAAKADAVLIGNLVAFDISRVVRGDAPEDVVVYGKATLMTTEMLAGEGGWVSVPLEFLLPVPPAEAEETIRSLQDALPSEEAVFFLRNKGGEEEGLFRVVNSTGLWAETARATLDTPLAETPPREAGIYAQELADVDTVEELLDLLRGA